VSGTALQTRDIIIENPRKRVLKYSKAIKYGVASVGPNKWEITINKSFFY